MRVIIILLALLMTMGIGMANNAKQALERFDIGFYNPVLMGARDLVFELRIGNMTAMLNEAKYFGKIQEAYFEVYWTQGQTAKILTMGLPEGFSEKKKQLEAIAKNKLEFVIPTSLVKRFKNHQLKTTISSKGTLIRAITKDIADGYDEVKILFDKSGKLKRITTSGPVGTNTARFEMSSKGWSKNKWVLDKMEVEILAGIQKSIVEYDFEYEVINGIGLPKEIRTSAQYFLVKTKKKQQPKKIQDVLKFTNYVLNTGRGAKKIRGMRK